MCFFSSPKTPEVQQAPTPPPYIMAQAPAAPGGASALTQTPSAGSPPATGTGGETPSSVTEEGRRRQLERMRSGFIRTIRTSAKGITGSKPDLRAAALYGGSTLGG